MFQTYIETTETNRTVLKQTETNKKTLNFLKSTLYQTVLVGVLFVSDQSKHRNSQFRYRTETTEINCFETNRNKQKQNKTNPNNP